MKLEIKISVVNDDFREVASNSLAVTLATVKPACVEDLAHYLALDIAEQLKASEEKLAPVAKEGIESAESARYAEQLEGLKSNASFAGIHESELLAYLRSRRHTPQGVTALEEINPQRVAWINDNWLMIKFVIQGEQAKTHAEEGA